MLATMMVSFRLTMLLDGVHAHFFYLFVNVGVFFDVHVLCGHVGFRLVVVVEADEVLHAVVREELFEFSVKLRRQGFVMRDNQSGLLEFVDDVCHDEGFAASRYAQQRLLSFLEKFSLAAQLRFLVQARFCMAIQVRIACLFPQTTRNVLN